jgi:hypothetical protein
MDSPTNVMGNTLDLILSNVPNRVIQVKEVGRQTWKERYHVIIQASKDKRLKEAKMTVYVPNWAQANWVSIRAEMREKDWPELLSGGTLSEAWCAFRDLAADLVEEQVLVLPCRAPVWMKRELTRLLGKKRKFFLRAGCRPKEMSKYKEAEKQAANAKRNFEKKLAKEKTKKK